MEKILVLNGSFCEIPVIKKLKEMGYYVVTTGNVPELEGHAFADWYIPADYSDRERILELVRQNGIDGVISCANDFGTITAAYVSEQMGWKGHDTYENTLLLHHKDRFKRYCLEHSIPSVMSEVFGRQEDLLEYVRSCAYPVIIKANDLTGGKGIQRANNYRQACEAVGNAFSASRDKKVVVEPFVTGTQHALDAFIVDGEIVATTTCNCYSYVNPYLIQTETYPSDFAGQDTEPVCRAILSMVKDLHLADGVFTVQYMKDKGQIYIIEVMRRLTGNLSFTLYEKATGFPWYEGYIRSSLGLDCSGLEGGEPEARYCGHHGIFARENGRIVDYTIPRDIQEHVFGFVELMERGRMVSDYLRQRIASFFYAYDSREEMERAARGFYDRIIVEMGK